MAGYLHRVDGPGMNREQLRERDARVLAVYQVQRQIAADTAATEPERKRNQTCWLCDQRRTCVQTARGWECVLCRQVT
jgi:hypothetical protein